MLNTRPLAGSRPSRDRQIPGAGGDARALAPAASRRHRSASGYATESSRQQGGALASGVQTRVSRREPGSQITTNGTPRHVVPLGSGPQDVPDSLARLVDSRFAEGRSASKPERRGTAGTAGVRQSSTPASVQGRNGDLDFDEEARKLWSRMDKEGAPARSANRTPAGPSTSVRGADLNSIWTRLNLDPATINGDHFSAMDPLWRHPKSGATFYVGNQVAASSLPMLGKNKITHVVNCTNNMPNFHQKDAGAGITYFRFDITSHYGKVRSERDAVRFVQPVLDFVSDALQNGNNVMVHCLAGAHRAGTTGVLCLMYFAGLSVDEAVPTAKRLRPIIDPIGGFPQLLRFVESGWNKQESVTN